LFLLSPGTAAAQTCPSLPTGATGSPTGVTFNRVAPAGYTVTIMSAAGVTVYSQVQASPTSMISITLTTGSYTWTVQKPGSSCRGGAGAFRAPPVSPPSTCPALPTGATDTSTSVNFTGGGAPAGSTVTISTADGTAVYNQVQAAATSTIPIAL